MMTILKTIVSLFKHKIRKLGYKRRYREMLIKNIKFK